MAETDRKKPADRIEFALDADALDMWDALNARPERDLPGLRALIERPTPFVDD